MRKIQKNLRRYISKISSFLHVCTPTFPSPWYLSPLPSPCFIFSAQKVFSFSKYFPLFLSLFFFSSKKIFYKSNFPSFSFSVFLMKRNISLNIFSLFLLWLSSPPKIYFFFSKYFPPFPTLFCFSSAKQKISFYKYYPTFPSPLICQIICSFSFSGI